LQLQGAISIQALTLEQINQYLEQAGNQLEAVKALLQEDTELQKLIEVTFNAQYYEPNVPRQFG